jgi:hypothetical protein
VILPGWFVAPAEGDLHLTPNASRALDAGLLLKGMEHDFDREIRPDGLKPDIGADELKSADLDGDTIPDRVEVAPSPFRAGIDDRLADYDNDGASNAQEFFSLTNPDDFASALKLFNPLSNGPFFAFLVPTREGLEYQIQQTNGFVPIQWETLSSVNGTGESILVNVPIDAPDKYFRVRAQLHAYEVQ